MGKQRKQCSVKDKLAIETDKMIDEFTKGNVIEIVEELDALSGLISLITTEPRAMTNDRVCLALQMLSDGISLLGKVICCEKLNTFHRTHTIPLTEKPD